jgi:hypothetical protein
MDANKKPAIPSFGLVDAESLKLGQGMLKDMAKTDKSAKAVVRMMYDKGVRWHMIGGKDAVTGVQNQVKAYLIKCMPEVQQEVLALKRGDLSLTKQETYDTAATTLKGAFAYVVRTAKVNEGIATPRKPKEKDATPVTVFVAPDNPEQAMVSFTATVAKVNTWGYSAKAAADIADAVNHAIAVMRSNKPAAK